MSAYTDLINVDELKAISASAEVRIVDCRHNLMDTGQGHREYLEGHIPGAVYAHLDDDLASPITAESGRHPLPDVDDFVRTLGAWGINQDTQVVVYDHNNGAVAARLWWMLRWLGHDNVAVLNGGFAAWVRAGGVPETDVVEYSATTFVATPNPGMVATTTEIAEAVAAGDEMNLVDARDAPRFNGEMEPIDAIAGHVPGALNKPFLGGVHADGTWLERDQHRQSWDKLLAGRSEKALIAMCGSGVTACHLLISARLSGLPEPRLYVGSWSEWIRDEGRPVASAD